MKGKGGKATSEPEVNRVEDAASLDWETPGAKMADVVENFKEDLAPLRVGRADPSLLEPISVSVKASIYNSILTYNSREISAAMCLWVP